MEEVKTSLVDRIKTYIKETQAEAKKVSWPDRRYVTVATLIIVFMVLTLSVVIMFLDLGLANVVMMLTRVR